MKLSDDKIKEFQSVCIPVVAWIKKNCCPHDSVIITDEQFKLVSDEISFPINGAAGKDICL